MCDIVMFPIVLGLEAPSSTVCPVSGESITFTVTKTGLEDLSHPNPWFTLAPAHGGDIRKVNCNRVKIYADRAKEEAAIAAVPDLACAHIAELWQGTKDLADMF
ncbi:organomercurial lyase [Stenotrophomonas lacuserhaii]|uniref:organomercurial lyase n=1 Tax=Stenotrophomonas lacuserhaii TaxID=2760084 RepID=UPI0032EE48B2